MRARFALRVAGCEPRERGRSQPCGALERGRELLGAHGLEQVADGLRFESLDGVGVVGGREHHRRRRFEQRQVARRLESIHAGHAHIEQHHIGLEFAREPHRLFAVGRNARDLDVAEFIEQPPEPLACRRLIVDDEHALVHSDEVRVASSTYGKRSRTMYSSPMRLASTEERPG